MSARSVPAYGPAMKFPSSRTRIPSSASVGTDDPVVEREELVGDVRPVELSRADRAGFTELLPQRGLGHEALERAAQRVDVAGLDAQPGEVALDDLLVGMEVARDRRGPSGHRREQHDAGRLLTGRWGAEDVGGLVEARLVG